MNTETIFYIHSCLLFPISKTTTTAIALNTYRVIRYRQTTQQSSHLAYHVLPLSRRWTPPGKLPSSLSSFSYESHTEIHKINIINIIIEVKEV